MTFTSCPNRKSKFNIKKNHISTTTRGKFTIFTPLYRSLIVKKIFTNGDPNLTFTSCLNRKSNFNINKKSYLNNHKRLIHNFCTVVQIVNCQKKIKKWPNLTFTSCPNRKSKFNIKKNHISTTASGKLTLFAPLYWSLIVKKNSKRWPQFDFYFLSIPEVNV